MAARPSTTRPARHTIAANRQRVSAMVVGHRRTSFGAGPRRWARRRGWWGRRLAVAWPWTLGVAAAALLTGGLLLEARASYLQSRLASHLARQMTFTLGAGPSPLIRFPRDGPYDQRLGYVALPEA